MEHIPGSPELHRRHDVPCDTSVSSGGRCRVQKQENFPANVRFNANVIREAVSVCSRIVGTDAKMGIGLGPTVGRGEEAWSFDSIEEFLADYRRGYDSATLDVIAACTSPPADNSAARYLGVRINLQTRIPSKIVILSNSRAAIEEVSEVFHKHLAESIVTTPPPPPLPVRIFVGHGHSGDWRLLKDHLQDKFGYQVDAYEVGARAGHAVRDVLEDMLAGSAFAVLVMTAEDPTPDGDRRARQNVIHELGLFQGRLGWHRAIALVEEGVELFSNIEGVEQIRYQPGNIPPRSVTFSRRCNGSLDRHPAADRRRLESRAATFKHTCVHMFNCEAPWVR